METPSSQRSYMRAGDTVVLRLPSGTHKSAKLIPKTSIKLGKFGTINDASDLIDQPYGLTYEIEGDGKLRVVLDYSLSEIEMTDETNEDISANIGAQTLSTVDIETFKKLGMDAREIIQKQVEQHQAFSLKTGFSKDKYIKRKQSKFMKIFTPVQPSLHNITQSLFIKNPLKTQLLRPDTLSQMLSFSAVRPGCRTLIFDQIGGLLIGAVLERLGGEGLAFSLTDNDSPPDTSILKTMGLSDEEMRVWKSMHLLGLNPEFDIDGELGPPPPPPPPPAEGEENRGGTKEKIKDVKRRERREKFEDARQDLQSGDFDSLLIVSTYEPASLINLLSPFLAGSASIAIYHPQIEALKKCHTMMKFSKNFVNEQVTESFIKEWQVLPGRTHPHVRGYGGGMNGGGFILSAVKVLGDE
ncbi:Gcd10p-domain-containing protein [Atractiella rhizophila]|nr:Gcd10p-domain-containing protein [Atractiella rhizophila]